MRTWVPSLRMRCIGAVRRILRARATPGNRSCSGSRLAVHRGSAGVGWARLGLHRHDVATGCGDALRCVLRRHDLLGCGQHGSFAHGPSVSAAGGRRGQRTAGASSGRRRPACRPRPPRAAPQIQRRAASARPARPGCRGGGAGHRREQPVHVEVGGPAHGAVGDHLGR
jgi:hypothetical protein